MAKAFIIIISVVLLFLIFNLIPKDIKLDASTVVGNVGTLRPLHGKAIVFPFFRPYHIGTWAAEWEGSGEVGKEVTFIGGRIAFSTMYFPGGAIMRFSQYRFDAPGSSTWSGRPFGSLTGFYSSGQIYYRHDHDSSGNVFQQMYYDKNGKIVFHMVGDDILVADYCPEGRLVLPSNVDQNWQNTRADNLLP